MEANYFSTAARTTAEMCPLNSGMTSQQDSTKSEVNWGGPLSELTTFNPVFHVRGDGTSTHVQQQSWDGWANSYAGLTIDKPSSTKPSFRREPKASRPKRNGPQRKRRADESNKGDKIWDMTDLQRELLQPSSSGRLAKARLRMDIDILRRRIAEIEACERRKEQRRVATGGAQSEQTQKHGKKRSSFESEDTIMEWEEPVIR